MKPLAICDQLLHLVITQLKSKIQRKSIAISFNLLIQSLVIYPVQFCQNFVDHEPLTVEGEYPLYYLLAEKTLFYIVL